MNGVGKRLHHTSGQIVQMIRQFETGMRRYGHKIRERAGPVHAQERVRIEPGEHAADLEESAGFRLEPTGRYSHSRAYLERTLSAAGLTVRAIREVSPRKQLGKPVAGLLVAAGRL